MKKKAKILIVDDEINVINALRRIFDVEKYKVIFTTKPEEAIEIFQKDIDVIICDHNMPNMSGIEVLRHAKEILPNTIRILITGYSDLDIAISAINEGSIYYFFSKPWKNQEIISVVEKSLNHKYELDKKTVLYDVLNDNNNFLDDFAKGRKSTNANSIKKLPVREGEDIILIDPMEILYLYAMDGNVFVITETKKYKTPESLKWWEDNLGKDNFFRTHRSYIVNIEKIEKITPWFNGAFNINLKNLEENIPVSRRTINDLKALLGI